MPTTPEPKATRRSSDTELRVIAKIIGELSELEPTTRARVLAYVNERFSALLEPGLDG